MTNKGATIAQTSVTHAGKTYSVPAMQAVFDEFVRTGRVPEVQLSPNHATGTSGVHKKTT